MAYSAGEAEIVIKPSLRNFATDLKAELRRILAEYLVTVKADMTEFRNSLQAGLSAVRAELDVNVRADLTEFRRELQAGLDATNADYDVNVRADLTQFHAQLNALAGGDVSVAVKVDESLALARLAGVHARMQAWLSQNPLIVDIDVDDAAARARLADLTRSRTTRLRVDVDEGGRGGGGKGGDSFLSKIFDHDWDGMALKAAKVTGAFAGLAGAAGLAGGAIGGLALGAMPALMGLGTAAGVAILGMDGIKLAAQNAAPAFSELKSAVSSTFAQELAPGMAQVGEILSSITPQLQGIASSMSGVFNNVIGAIRDDGMNELHSILAGTSQMITAMGPGIQQLTQGFLNMGAAAAPVMSKIGQGFGSIMNSIGDAVGAIPTQFFAEFGSMLERIGPALGSVITSLASLGQSIMPVIGPLLQSLSVGIENLVPGLAAIGTSLANALQPVLPILGQLISSIGSALAPALGPVSTFLQTLGNALVAVMPSIGQLVTAFTSLAGPVLSGLVTALQPVVQALAQGLTAALNALQPAIGPVTQMFQTLSPVLAQLATTLGSVLAQAITTLTPEITGIANAFAQILPQLTPLIPILGDALISILQALAPQIETGAKAWTQVVQAIVPLIPQMMQLVQTILPPLVQLITSLAPLIPTVAMAFAQLVPVLVPLISKFLELEQHVAGFVAAVLSFVARVIGAITGFVANVVANFTGMAQTVGGIVSGFVASVIGFFTNLVSSAVEKAKEIWTNVKNAFTTGVSDAVSAVTSLKDKVTSALSGAGEWLVDMGKRVVQGLINGIKSMMSSLGDAVSSIGDKVKSIATLGLAHATGGIVGGTVPGFAEGGQMPLLAGGGETTTAATRIKPGSFIVNAAAARRHRAVLEEIAPQGRFISGPGSGTSDSIAAVHNGRQVAAVSSGEYEVPPEQAGAILPLLLAINAGKGLASAAISRVQALAGGGVVTADEVKAFVNGQSVRGVRANRSLQGAPYTNSPAMGEWGDCSSTQSAISAFMLGLNPFPRKFSTASEESWLSANGANIGNNAPANAYRVGWYNGGAGGGHTAGYLPDGTPVEMGGSNSGGAIGARFDDSQFTNWAWIPAKAADPAAAPATDPTNSGNGIGSTTAGGDANSYDYSSLSDKQQRKQAYENDNLQAKQEYDDEVKKLKEKYHIGTSGDEIDQKKRDLAARKRALESKYRDDKIAARGDKAKLKQLAADYQKASDALADESDRLANEKDTQTTASAADKAKYDDELAALKKKYEQDTLARKQAYDKANDSSQESYPTTFSGWAGFAASNLIEGQVKSGLDVLGISDSPAWLTGINNVQKNLHKTGDKTLTGRQGGAGTTPTTTTSGDSTLSGTLGGALTGAGAPSTSGAVANGMPVITYNPSGGAEQWRPLMQWAITHVAQGLTAAASQVDAGVAQIKSESGGDPNITQQVADVNSGVDPAVGLLQVIQQTFNAFRDSSLPNDRKDPAANIVAALRYYVKQYGTDLTKEWGHGHGYRSGGYTGDGNPWDVAGPVHRGEFVFDAITTRKNMPLLQAIYRGDVPTPQLAGVARTQAPAAVAAPGTGYRDHVEYHISTARVEDAFNEARSREDRRAAMSIERW